MNATPAKESASSFHCGTSAPPRPPFRQALRIALLYALFASIWILASDRIAAGLAGNYLALTWLQSAKGAAFVTATAVMLLMLIYRSLSRLEDSRVALAESDTAYRHLFAAHPHPMWVMDARSLRFLDVNQAAIASYGYRREDFDRMTPVDLHVPEEAEAVRARLSLERPCAGRPASEWRHRTRDGTVIDVEISCHEVSFRGQPAILFMALDITQRRRVETAMHSLNTELERRVAERTAQLDASARELEAFSYSVSHDLRAPLRAIDGYSAMLESGDACRSDAEARKLLTRVRSAVSRMSQLIEDLLALSRVSRDEPVREKVDLGRIAREVCVELADADAHHRPRLDIATGLDIEADPRLMRVVLGNLFANAWKFTSRKADAQIAFYCRRMEGLTIFTISDNGAGFDMRYSGNLFRPFQRLHSERDFPGSGIGLATVARIIHRHGGEIWAEGSPDQGARFHFTLDGIVAASMRDALPPA